MSEYNKGMANWKSKPATMINKCAVSQCVRDAFPKDFEGIYSEDEMIASGAIAIDRNGEVIVLDGDGNGNGEEDEDPVITKEQRQSLFNTIYTAFGKEEGNAVLKQLINEAGFESTNNMPSSVYMKILTQVMDLCDAKRDEEAQRASENPEEPPTEE